MAFTTVITENPGGVIASADWNTYVRDNINWITSLSGLIGYATTILSGFTEQTAVRGRLIIGVPSGGTVSGTVGTALTDLQDKTHTHSVPYSGWAKDADGSSGQLIIKDTSNPTPSQVVAGSADNTSGATAGSSVGVVYIQYYAINHQ